MPSYRSSEPASRPDYVKPGDYTVEVINAEETVSKQGRDMIELKLKVIPEGTVFFDHLVFVENAYWKIDAFRAAIGEAVLPGEDVDINADDFIGKTGRVRLTVEEFNGRTRNRIGAWLVPQTKPAAAPAKAKGGDDDSIPF